MGWMGWVGAELVALAGPAYFFLQIMMAARYRGRWRWAALAPLLVMGPLAIEAGLAYAAGVPGWITLLVVTAPVACLYLLGLAACKAWKESAQARRGR